MIKIHKWLDYIIRDPDTLEFLGWKEGTPQEIKDSYFEDLREEEEFEKYCIEELKKQGFTPETLYELET